MSFMALVTGKFVPEAVEFLENYDYSNCTSDTVINDLIPVAVTGDTSREIIDAIGIDSNDPSQFHNILNSDAIERLEAWLVTKNEAADDEGVRKIISLARLGFVVSWMDYC